MFKKIIHKISTGALLVALTVTSLTGCGGSSGAGNTGPTGGISPELIASVTRSYANIVHASYEDSLTRAIELQTAIRTFVANPDQAKFDAAKQAWKSARAVYGQTEAYRFYDGPIDNATNGPETFINAWPLDEAHIDYIQGSANAGIINDTANFPTITKQLLIDQNEKDGETNISTGYHAIEFLLWGQDLNRPPHIGGERPFTDYLLGGTAANQQRRGEYLQAAADLLVEHLTFLVDEWSPVRPNNYRTRFIANPNQALRDIVLGFGSLGAGELTGERMSKAYDLRNQEEEHSCFSDNTHVDLFANIVGIENVYRGRYTRINGQVIQGPSIDDIVRVKNTDLANKLTGEIRESIFRINEIVQAANAGTPFDQQIMQDAPLPGRPRIFAAIQALQTQTRSISEAARALELNITLDGDGR